MLDDSTKKPYLTLYISSLRELVLMNDTVRDSHNFTVHKT